MICLSSENEFNIIDINRVFVPANKKRVVLDDSDSCSTNDDTECVKRYEVDKDLAKIIGIEPINRLITKTDLVR